MKPSWKKITRFTFLYIFRTTYSTYMLTSVANSLNFKKDWIWKNCNIYGLSFWPQKCELLILQSWQHWLKYIYKQAWICLQKICTAFYMEICPIFKASSHLLQDIRDLKIKGGLNPLKMVVIIHLKRMGCWTLG